jgi:uncharacterized protein
LALVKLHSGRIHINSLFRFYQELNDFLPNEKKQKEFNYHFQGTPSIKDSIEAIGVPHTEVDLILVDGESVDFNYRLKGGEKISVYPVFESFDISGLNRLRPEPLRETKFILDVHLGTLARYLRMAGFDTAYRNNLDDPEIAQISKTDHRIVLTRDIGLLKRSEVRRGYWVRNTDPDKQFVEVMNRLHLASKIKPFRRCLTCNGEIVEVSKDTIMHLLPPRTKKFYNDFRRCSNCGKIYWKGSHYHKMLRKIHCLLESNHENS